MSSLRSEVQTVMPADDGVLEPNQLRVGTLRPDAPNNSSAADQHYALIPGEPCKATTTARVWPYEAKAGPNRADSEFPTREMLLIS